MSRITYRGGDRWSSNGRPAGFVLKPARRPSLVDVMRAKGPRLTTIVAIAVTVVVVIHFGGQILLALAYGGNDDVRRNGRQPGGAETEHSAPPATLRPGRSGRPLDPRHRR
jgi:hypothetical protein